MREFFRTRLNGYCLLLVRDGSSWHAYRDESHSTYGHSSPPDTRSMEEWVRDVACGTTPVVSELGAGEHYGRMWRGGAWPDVEETTCAIAWRDSVRVTRMLVRRLKAVFDDIEPVRAHDSVYGHELRMLLLLACNEVESSCKAILTEHGVRPLGDYFTMKDYRKLAAVMRLSEWEVTLSTNPGYGPIAAFAGWATGPNATLAWYQAHNAVKHDREKMLGCATLGNTITAVAAAFTLRVAQFGLPCDEPFAGLSDIDEFVVRREPAWTDTERYIAPSAPRTKSGLIGAPVARKHPSL